MADARLCRDARGRDGGVREGLAAGVVEAPDRGGSNQHPASVNLKTTRSWRGIVLFTHLEREGRMTVTIGRLELLIALGGAAVAWPLAARAQQPGKLPTIGFLGGASALTESQWAATFVRRLHELGWTEGRTVAIEYRWAEGRNEPAEIVAEVVRLKVDIVVTYGTPSILAAKQATSTIPIVFAAAGDPVRTGIVASLAWPGGNASGLSLQKVDLADKRLELLREVVPGFRRLAIMANIEPHARRQGSC